jgi:hypothetical protein
MTDKASPAGWVIQVATPAPPSKEGARWLGTALLDAPSFKYFNVAMAEPDEAVEATAKYLAKAKGDTVDGVETSAVRALSSAEIDALGLKTGQVKPA